MRAVLRRHVCTPPRRAGALRFFGCLLSVTRAHKLLRAFYHFLDCLITARSVDSQLSVHTAPGFIIQRTGANLHRNAKLLYILKRTPKKRIGGHITFPPMLPGKKRLAGQLRIILPPCGLSRNKRVRRQDQIPRSKLSESVHVRHCRTENVHRSLRPCFQLLQQPFWQRLCTRTGTAFHKFFCLYHTSAPNSISRTETLFIQKVPSFNF